MKMRMANDPQFREELKRKREMEVEMRGIMQSALVRLARINMDQAIQIAARQVPGKVLNCNLDCGQMGGARKACAGRKSLLPLGYCGQ